MTVTHQPCQNCWINQHFTRHCGISNGFFCLPLISRCCSLPMDHGSPWSSTWLPATVLDHCSHWLPIAISGCNHEGNHEGNHGSESADQVLIDTMVFLTLIQPHRFFLLSFFLLAWFFYVFSYSWLLMLRLTIVYSWLTIVGSQRHGFSYSWLVTNSTHGHHSSTSFNQRMLRCSHGCSSCAGYSAARAATHPGGDLELPWGPLTSHVIIVSKRWSSLANQPWLSWKWCKNRG